ADRDHEIERLVRELIHALWDTGRDVDTYFFHRLHRMRIDTRGRLCSRGVDVEPLIEGFQESRGHLAPRRIPTAQHQNAFLGRFSSRNCRNQGQQIKKNSDLDSHQASFRIFDYSTVAEI